MDLEFEKISLDHASSLLPLWQDNNVTKYTYIRDINSIDDVKNKIQRFLNYPYGIIGPFVVKIDQEVIGLAAGMSNETNPDSSEIIFHFSEKHWRKGIGSQSIDFLLHEGFCNNNLKEIKAQAVTDNLASWKLLEKKGFRNKSLKNKAFGNTHNTYLYSMSFKDFKNL